MTAIDSSKVVGVSFVKEDGTVLKVDHTVGRSNSLRIIEFRSIEEIDNLIRDLRVLKNGVNKGFFDKDDI